MYTIAVQNDGKILIGGSFSQYNGTSVMYLARLLSSGELDTTFNNGASGPNSNVSAIAIQDEEKILIGGYFTSYNGTSRYRIARLNADGSLDSSFDPGSGANAFVTAVVIQDEENILIGGDFTSYGGNYVSRIARLNSNGSLDVNFNSGCGFNGIVTSIVIQSDGKILIAGHFTNYNGTEQNRIVRLNPDGSLDTSFNWRSGANKKIYSMAVQSDKKILIEGEFTSYDDVARNFIARIWY